MTTSRAPIAQIRRAASNGDRSPPSADTSTSFPKNASKDAHECGLRTEPRNLEGEICRVPSWQSLERGDVALEVSARKGAHRWCDPIDDRVSHRDHAADPTGHPSRLPKSLTLQFFDDELVIRRTSAVRTKQTAVRVAHRIGPFPPAEPAEGVGDRHCAPQKKSSSVSFFSARRCPSEAGASSGKSPLSRDFCCAGCVPVNSAFSSQP